MNENLSKEHPVAQNSSTGDLIFEELENQIPNPEKATEGFNALVNSIQNHSDDRFDLTFIYTDTELESIAKKIEQAVPNSKIIMVKLADQNNDQLMIYPLLSSIYEKTHQQNPEKLLIIWITDLPEQRDKLNIFIPSLNMTGSNTCLPSSVILISTSNKTHAEILERAPDFSNRYLNHTYDLRGLKI